ncbi:MAG: long-chain fatty acid--CoA ligase, partial [Novosphingobium sp.]|nr:long-chain fatty acid--CoA ligase [Novosphingobium sp.]
MMDKQEAIEQCLSAVAELTRPGGDFEIADRDNPQKRRYAGTPRNLNRFLEGARKAHRDQDFLEFSGERVTFGQVFDRANALAAGLYARYAIGQGDVVGLAMHNCLDWFVGFFAILRTGAVAALLNSRGAGEEIADAASRTDCRLILADDKRAASLAGLSECPVIAADALD